MRSWSLFCLVIICCIEGTYQKTEYHLGGAFSNSVHQIAFDVIINKLNWQNKENSFEIATEGYNVSHWNNLDAGKTVCNLLERGVIGIFGPSSIHTSNYIQSICDNKEIPQVETHYDFKVKRNRCVVNLHPHPSEIAHFFVYLIRLYNWKSVIILFENYDSLVRITPLLDLNSEDEITLIFRQLEVGPSGSYREVLNNVKKLPDKNILLECSQSILETVLIQAQQVGLMTEKYAYIVTNLDLSTIDMEPFQYGGTNITGIRIFDPDDQYVQELNAEIVDLLKTEPEKEKNNKMHLSTALLVDGANMFYDVFKDLVAARNGLEVQSISCRGMDSWKHGLTIANQLRGKEYTGITGPVSFDFEGLRRHFKLDLVELTTDGLKKVGRWDTTTKTLRVDRMNVPQIEEPVSKPNLFNKTFKVVIVLTAPYAMLKQTSEQLSGNDRFEGFCVDVINELSLELGFNYTFVVQEDGKNGNLNRSTNEWDGVIGEIIKGNADFAITDLTITSEREKAVDFSMPFMNLGIGILYRKPEPVPPSLFTFMSPFSTGVWLMMGVAYIFVSVAIFIISRLSSSEWTNPYPCIEEPEYLVNQFSIRNSLWFTIGGLLQQGSELAPMSISTRTASGFWWFFILVMVSSYTANLAAFLTVEALKTPFKNIDELAEQSLIKYGAKRQGATENFFKDSNLSTHQKIYQYMKFHPDQMTDENEEGIRRVENENYAFFMESTTIEYVIQRHCSLAQVGNRLDDKGYGIAMKQYSPYRNDLTTAIIKLQEHGVLTKLKIKWWKEKRGGSTCSSKKEQSEAKPLAFQHVSGVFFVLSLGAFLALIGSFLELLLMIYRKCKLKKIPFSQELLKEMRFFFQFEKHVKEVTSSEDSSLERNINK